MELAAGGGKLSDDLAGRLLAATEGNPLFTKELVRSLLDSGGIARDDSGALNLSGATGISSDALPETIQQAVEARIERLPEDVRDVLSIASVLGKSFEFKDLESVSEDAKGLDEAIDRLVKEGLLEEERESRGDRLAFASGIVRDVLYGALSRRKRRTLHRAYADLLEKRHQGRLDRVYPELVHHFSEGDVPGKAVDYSLKLARKSLDAFSPEEAARVAKTALDYLGDEEWEGEKALEGDARLLLAQASRMSGHADAALREAEAAGKIFEREKQPARAVEAILFAADTAWNARKVDEARRLVERGIEAAAAAQDTVHLPKLLSLAATVANLRGDYARAAAYGAQLERLGGDAKRGAEVIPTGGRLVVAMTNPVAAAEPAMRHIVEETEILSTVFETLLTTDADGQLVPALADEWSLGDGGRSARLRLRHGVRFSDGSPLTAAAAKASLERAIRVRPDGIPAALAAVRGAEAHRKNEAADVAGIRAVSDDRLEFEFVEPLPIFPALLPDVLTAIVRIVPGEGDARDGDRHGPVRRRAPDGGPRRPRAQPAPLEGAGAPRRDRVPDRDERVGDRLGAARRRDRARARSLPAGPRRDPQGAAPPRGPRRNAEERHVLRALQLEERPRRERRPEARARRRDAQPGLRVGRARAVRRPRHRDPAARHPRTRRGPAPAAPAAGRGARPPRRKPA